MKHIICYSGGHGSAIEAIEVVRKFVILLNHDISHRRENADIKRFKKEIAEYLGIEITYANYRNLPADSLPDQFDVVEEAGSFLNPHTRQALCTTRLKTEPFELFLATHFPNGGCTAYYGYDGKEYSRLDRRKKVLNDMGYDMDCVALMWGPGQFQKLRQWYIDHGATDDSVDYILKFEKFENRDHYDRTIFSTREIGIEPPNSYNKYKHANCTGCLKAGQQHWYVVYCNDRECYDRGKLSEKRIGYTIIKGVSLEELEPKFEKMRLAGVPDTEHIPFQTFWAMAKRYLKIAEQDNKPCECSF
jgi:hypothetical protein